jgi:uncharacterized membrane protein YdjX (TVP38/TMEM64 family)
MRRYRALIVYVGAVMLLAAAYFWLPVSQDVVVQELGAVAAYARGDLVATAVLFLLLSMGLVYLAFPAMPMVYIAAGYCLDFSAGGAAVLLGSAIGGVGAYLLYRDHIPRHHQLSQRDCSSLNLWLTLLGLRLSPIVPAPLVNLFAALAGVSPLQHLMTTLIGGAPLILFYVEIGQQGYLTASGEMPQWWRFSGCLVILVLSTVLTLLGPWRSVLTTLKLLRDDAVASLKRSVSAEWAPPEPARPIGD